MDFPKVTVPLDNGVFVSRLIHFRGKDSYTKEPKKSYSAYDFFITKQYKFRDGKFITKEQCRNAVNENNIWKGI
jgi:hypothetical protein